MRDRFALKMLAVWERLPDERHGRWRCANCGGTTWAERVKGEAMALCAEAVD